MNVIKNTIKKDHFSSQRQIPMPPREKSFSDEINYKFPHREQTRVCPNLKTKVLERETFVCN